MKNVTPEQVATPEEAQGTELPARVHEALGELAGAAKEGLMALSVGVGLGVLHELMEAEVDEVVGPKGRHLPDRRAKRHGHEQSSVTLGARRTPISRPRVRSADDEREVALETFGHFAARDPLSDVVLERVLAGVSTRRFARASEPVGAGVEAAARSQSKSAVSREFVAKTAENLAALMARRLDDLRLAVLMLDGIELKGRCCVVALGITTEGEKIPLGLWEGSTENAAMATALLSDLVDRGLDTSQGVLCVIDGAKALRKAVRDVLGVQTPVQRCIRHKERNVADHLPERDRPGVQGNEALSGARRELDELAIQVAGVKDSVEASELVDELYQWLPLYTEERAGVEEMAVSGRQARAGTARLRNIVEQAFGELDITVPWLDDIDALWQPYELPDEAPNTSGQGSVLGFDGHIEEPTDVRFGDQWVRFETEAQADYVRTLATARMAPRRIAVPPGEVAGAVTEKATRFIEDQQRALREALSERIDNEDPNYPDVFVQGLTRLAAAVRTALHASD